MKRATYEDVLNAPENKVAEILDGELFLSPRPALRHAGAQASRSSAALVPLRRRRAAAPAAGGSCRSPSCTSGRTSSSPTRGLAT